jgi:membrane associated rhomboid family serine protease
LATGVVGFFRETLSGEAPFTRLFLGLNLLVFALCMVSDHRLPLFQDNFRISTTVRFGALVGRLGAAQPWRYLSAVFVHFNVLHVGMNCWVLSRVGASAERELGKARFVVLFVISGVLGFVVSTLWSGGVDPPTAGASGALFGLFGSVVGILLARRNPAWKQALLENLVWIAILAFMGPINNAAHVGGLAAGALLGFLFSKEPRKLRLDLPFGLIAGLLLVLSLASVVLSALSPAWRIVRDQENSIQT